MASSREDRRLRQAGRGRSATSRVRSTTGRDVDPDYLERDAQRVGRVRDRGGAPDPREAGDGEVVVVSVGGEEAEEALRRCLAMGADRAVRVELGRRADPLAVARALAARSSRREQPDLVLCGVQSSDAVQGGDRDGARRAARAAAGRGRHEVDWARRRRAATVDRELEGGLVEVVEVDTPALLTIQTGINEPRYANLRAIKQAEQQEIALVEPDGGGEPAYRVRRMFAPPQGRGSRDARRRAGGDRRADRRDRPRSA